MFGVSDWCVGAGMAEMAGIAGGGTREMTLGVITVTRSAILPGIAKEGNYTYIYSWFVY